jgi:predicted DNA-binding protein (UPF0251 family)
LVEGGQPAADFLGVSTKTRISPSGNTRRRKIASGIIEGKSLAAIAREEGVSRQTIWKQMRSEEVQQIVIAAANSQRDELCELFLRALEVIREAFDARLVRVGKDGAPVDLGPDHYARLAAVGALLKVMTAGRPIPKAPAPAPGRNDGTMTLAELEAQLGVNCDQGSRGAPDLAR